MARVGFQPIPTPKAQLPPTVSWQSLSRRDVDAARNHAKVSYGGAVHSFTDWGAGTDASRGSAYNERADKGSWESMKSFFAELFH